MGIRAGRRPDAHTNGTVQKRYSRVAETVRGLP